MRWLVALALILVGFGPLGAQDAGHMVTVRIPPILRLRVEGTGLQLDALEEKGPLELGEGRHALRVVSNTAWTLRIEVSGEPLRLIEGQGRAEIALTVPPWGKRPDLPAAQILGGILAAPPSGLGASEGGVEVGLPLLAPEEGLLPLQPGLEGLPPPPLRSWTVEVVGEGGTVSW